MSELDTTPAPGYSEDHPGHVPPTIALPVVGMALYTIRGTPCVVIEVGLDPGQLLGIILDADDTEAIARLAAEVATMRRHDA